MKTTASPCFHVVDAAALTTAKRTGGRESATLTISPTNSQRVLSVAVETRLGCCHQTRCGHDTIHYPAATLQVSLSSHQTPYIQHKCPPNDTPDTIHIITHTTFSILKSLSIIFVYNIPFNNYQHIDILQRGVCCTVPGD